MSRSRLLAITATTAAIGVLLLSAASPALAAAPKPGGKCAKAGIFVHVARGDLKCVKKGKALVWMKVQGSGAGGGNGNSGNGGSSSGMGLASNTQIPKVIQNWGLALAPYDAASGKAGVMQLAGVTPPTFPNPEDNNMYSRIVGLYGEQLKGVQEPQMAFMAPLGTPVIAMVDGTVCDLPTLYSNDFSVRVAPTGVACSGNAANVLFEHEHLINPLVKLGDTVKAGQQIGTVSDFNPNWKAKGIGIIETGVFFMKNDNSGRPWHACLANYLAPDKAASMTATLSSIEQGWMSVRGDSALYNVAAQNPVGCLTQADITDSNVGVKQ